eukprot:356873_1
MAVPWTGSVRLTSDGPVKTHGVIGAASCATGGMTDGVSGITGATGTTGVALAHGSAWMASLQQAELRKSNTTPLQHDISAGLVIKSVPQAYVARLPVDIPLQSVKMEMMSQANIANVLQDVVICGCNVKSE